MNFAEFMRAFGLLPRDIVPDGRWRRCPTEAHPKKLNGTYKLAPDGRAGWCQNWETSADPEMWRPEGDEPNRIDFDALERRKAEARRDLIRATTEAREFYAGCKPLIGGHPYLEAHGLDMTGCRGLRIDTRGWLVVPVMIGRSLSSVQRISPEGDKKFWPGASVKGAAYCVNRPGASITVLCEGLATGLAIFACAPLSRVLVAFNAGNLPRVSAPSGFVVVAADNDHETEERIGRNPGVKAAQEAADAIGCGVAVPMGIAGTDWADWRMEMTAKRIADRHRVRLADIRRSVDAEIAAAMSRNARFLRCEVRHGQR